MQVIVTSYLFPNGNFSLEKLEKISSIVGIDRLVVDVRSRNFFFYSSTTAENDLAVVGVETNG